MKYDEMKYQVDNCQLASCILTFDNLGSKKWVMHFDISHVPKNMVVTFDNLGSKKLIAPTETWNKFWGVGIIIPTFFVKINCGTQISSF